MSIDSALSVPCPCGTSRGYDDCCGRLHRGELNAFTAELLMRSRYSAFAMGDAPYLLRTWHRSTRPKRLTLDPGIRWTRLEVLETDGGGPFDEQGQVQFRAHHEVIDGSTLHLSVLRERSQFVREDKRWVYLAAVS